MRTTWGVVALAVLLATGCGEKKTVAGGVNDGPRCGNGVVDPGEACDDGNTDNTDSCTTACRSPTCGDGVVQAGEECDQGSANSDTAADTCRENCLSPRCGDSVKDAGEACDDGNQVNDDSCTNACKSPACGDGLKQPGEACDDGAANSDTQPDACRKDCTTARCGDGVQDTGEDCDSGAANSDTEPNACRTSCTAPRCGDGVVDAGEGCDDGNGSNDDGCSTLCAPPACGDGIVEPGELCDDGAANSDTSADACRTTCAPAACGDGVKDTGEACDDGNHSDTDGCVNGCKLATCGDGLVEAGVETCDDGAANSDTAADACRTNCKPAHCGDGAVDTGESCDDGNQVDGDACTAACQVAFCGDGIVEVGVEQCDAGAANSDTDPGACRTTCKRASCGDGVQDPGENCDDGNTDATDACTATCKVAICGDGIVEKGVEECDDGGNNDDAKADACRTTCKRASCGDGVQDTGETCDDANADDNDGCSASCALEVLEPGNTVSVQTTIDGDSLQWGRPDDSCADVGNPASFPYAAYSFVNDTGKTLQAEFADAIEQGNAYIIVYSSFAPDKPGENCLLVGNDVIDPDTGEVDSSQDRVSLNMAPGDSVVVVVTSVFSKIPLNDLGHVTVSAQSSICGDGNVELREECDDGNVDDGDGCSSTCTVEAVCGNGKVEKGEECDDGNLDDGDGCSSKCTAEFPTPGHELELTGVVTNASSTFTRPEEDCSESKSDAAYEERVLTNDTGVDQEIRVEAVWSPKVDDYDGFVVAYVGDFDPADPSTNCVDASDDFDWDLDVLSDDGGLDGSRTGVFTVGAGQTLHVVVTANNAGNIIGPYRVYLENAGISLTEDEGNDNTGAANPVAIADVATGSVDFDGDVDVFSFEASAKGTYRVETSSQKLGICGDTDDTFLRIFDTDGATVISKADDGIDGSACAALIFQPSEDGTYYVEVSSADGFSAVDPYFLEVRSR